MPLKQPTCLADNRERWDGRRLVFVPVWTLFLQGNSNIDRGLGCSGGSGRRCLWLARLSKVPEGGLLKRGRKVCAIARGGCAEQAPTIGDVQHGVKNGMWGFECSRRGEGAVGCRFSSTQRHAGMRVTKVREIFRETNLEGQRLMDLDS